MLTEVSLSLANWVFLNSKTLFIILLHLSITVVLFAQDLKEIVVYFLRNRN